MSHKNAKIEKQKSARCRARELGFQFGRFKTGRWNSITDVSGVRVGHATVGNTGVTAVFPNKSGAFRERVPAGAFVLNGTGEMTGLAQVTEWGLLETPVLLTGTLSVGTAMDACAKYILKHNPRMGSLDDVVIPVVGECDDSWLNDAPSFPLRQKHVFDALNSARSGPVKEGSVGGGRGMMSFGFKAGIGTSSRVLSKEDGAYTLGVMVMSNFGLMRELRMEGAPVGQRLFPRFEKLKTRTKIAGSIIVVIATDAPVSAHQLNRICKRATLGLGRVGSFAAHGSGDIILGFSTANAVHRAKKTLTHKFDFLLNERLDPLFEATVDATEEAILNSLCMAEAVRGVRNHFAPELPTELVRGTA